MSEKRSSLFAESNSDGEKSFITLTFENKFCSTYLIPLLNSNIFGLF
jgi:hypothetical protein